MAIATIGKARPTQDRTSQTPSPTSAATSPTIVAPDNSSGIVLTDADAAAADRLGAAGGVWSGMDFDRVLMSDRDGPLAAPPPPQAQSRGEDDDGEQVEDGP
jgi:hypothetical protein